MVSRRAYKRVKVNSLDIKELVTVAKTEKSAVLGLDVAKAEIVACLRWQSEDFERPWSVSNPCGIDELVKLLTQLISHGLELKVALESTGTYGDAVRLKLTNAKIPVFRVSGKAVRDYREIFDGVPSQHDGKDAAMIAELCALSKGVLWPYVQPPEFMAEVAFHVRRMDAFQSELVQWYGRLESQLARFWPELGQLVKLNRKTVLKLLIQYGSPSAIAKSDNALEQVLAWSRGQLSVAKAESILQSARTTAGIPMTNQDQQWLQETSQRLLDAKTRAKACEIKLRKELEKDVFWSKYVDAVSAGTLSVILSTVGDPRAYSSAGALLKGCGLNLKEISSGKRIGEKSISKRGPSMLRRWLFFWAMRAIQKEELREWYFRFHNVNYGHRDRPSDHRKMKGLVCMMRKLMRSLWSSMKQGEAFDYTKVVEKKAKTKRRRRTRARQ